MNPATSIPTSRETDLDWGLATAVSALMAIAAMSTSPFEGWILTLGWVCSVNTLVWAGVASWIPCESGLGRDRSSKFHRGAIVQFRRILGWEAPNIVSQSKLDKRPLHGAWIAALLHAAAAFTFMLVALGTAALSAIADFVNGFYPAGGCLTLPPAGLLPLAMVLAATLLGYANNSSRRLISAAYWIGCAAALWIAMLIPSFDPDLGFPGRTGNTLLLETMLCGWLALLATLRIRGGARSNSGGLATITDRGDGTSDSRLLDTLSLTIGGILILLLGVFHLADPIFHNESARWAAAVNGGACAFTALAIWSTAVHRRHVGLADLSLGLWILAACSLASVAAPPGGIVANRFPMLFNCMMIGAGIVAAIMIESAMRHRRRMLAKQSQPAGWIAARLRRGSFGAIGLGLVFSAMMAAWPRIPGIAVSDDSLGRVAAGFCGNLFLTMVSVSGSARLGGWSFHMATVMAGLGCAALVAVRIVPFGP